MASARLSTKAGGATGAASSSRSPHPQPSPPARSPDPALLQKERTAEAREGVPPDAATLHQAVKHPPPQVERRVLQLAGGKRAILTTRAPFSDTQLAGSNAPRGVVITCGGAGGGPGHLGAAGPSSVYERLASTLPLSDNITVLQAVYRVASNVPEAVADVRACIDFCVERGWGPLALMGWSMGSAVIVQAGEPYAQRTMQTKQAPLIRALITLAGQSAGIQNISRYDAKKTAFLFVRRTSSQSYNSTCLIALACYCLLLLHFLISLCLLVCRWFQLHGDADDCLSARCADSLMAYAPTGADKQKVILPNNHHGVQSAEPILTKFLTRLFS